MLCLLHKNPLGKLVYLRDADLMAEEADTEGLWQGPRLCFKQSRPAQCFSGAARLAVPPGPCFWLRFVVCSRLPVGHSQCGILG